MILTVVVPTIPGRESLLSRCLFHLTVQAPETVEIIVVDGEGLLGDKVNRAVAAARGEYLTVVDDDDWVSADYFASILPLCDGVDYVGLQVLELDKGRFANITSTSAEFNLWGRRNRGPVPKGVTRAELWRANPMGNAYFADRAWMDAISAAVTSYSFVARPLYIYDFQGSSGVDFDAGTRDVGAWPYDASKIVRMSPP